jgi:hypothetical protein
MTLKIRHKASTAVAVRSVVCAVLLTCLVGLFGGPSRAAATPWDPHVRLSGHIDCGGINSASWVWVETSWGERGWASTSTWTSVSRPAGVLASKGLPAWLSVKIQNYDIHFWRVPRGTTHTVTLTIGCTTPFIGTKSQFSTSFGLARPTFGTSTTRHVCRNAVFGCVI